MAGPPRSLAVYLLIPVLSFAVGYLLGGRPAATPDQEFRAAQEELLALLRERPRSQPARTTSAPAGPIAAHPDGAGRPGAAGVRLPALDPWLQRIDEAVARLEQAAERSAATAPPRPSELYRRATNPALARNDRELKRFLDEYLAVEDGEWEFDGDYEAAWDKMTRKYRYQSLEQALDRFGRADDIMISGGTATLEYWEEVEHADGLVEDWGVSLEFYDGILVDFTGWWNRQD